MIVFTITDSDGKVFGVVPHKSIAMDSIEKTWPYSAGYQINVVHETVKEIKIVIRRPPRIGENPNETLILKILFITSSEIMEQPWHL